MKKKVLTAAIAAMCFVGTVSVVPIAGVAENVQEQTVLKENNDAITTTIAVTETKPVTTITMPVVDDPSIMTKEAQKPLISEDDILELSKKGDELTWSDFEKYEFTDIGDGTNIWQFVIKNSGSKLLVIGRNLKEKPEHINCVWSNGAEFDIRTEDLTPWFYDGAITTTIAVTGTKPVTTITMPVLDDPDIQTAVVTVTVMSVNGDDILVKPVDGSPELKSSNKFSLSAKKFPDDIKPKAGMKLEITYNGDILETYPAQFGNVQKIVAVKDDKVKDDATLLKGTKDMTLNDVMRLAEKGNELDWSDFKDYKGRDVGSGLYIWEYKLEGGFVLDVGGDIMKKPMYILLSHDNDKGIDIRTENVKEYIASTATPVVTENEKVKAVMLTTEEGNDGCYIHLDFTSGTFSMSGSIYQNFAIFGKFERKGNDLYLYAENGSTNVYVLHREDDHFISQSDEKGIKLTKGLVFSADNDAFWNKLTSTSENTVKGDANCDSDVNMSDAVIIMQSLANPAKYGVNGTDEHHITEQGKKNGDIAGNNDGITNSDALAIQKKLLGLNDENTIPVDESPVAADAGFTTTDGKRVSFGLYNKLRNNAGTDVEIAITPDYGVDYNYEYNGKTINQYHNEWDEDSALFEKYGQIVKDGDKLKYGEALYTTGTPYGEKWGKDFYYQRVSFYGEEFLAKYIVNGEFLIDKVLADQAAHQDEHKTTNHAYKALHEAIDAYNYEEIQATISQLEQQNIRYEYNETQKALIFYVTATQFEKLSLDNVSSYGLASSGSVVTMDL